MEITSSEFFRNMKSLPPKGSSEFEELSIWEEEKCKGGVTINGVFIPGWLYFHINHWMLRIDGKDNYGNVIRLPSLPHLRDNEWIRGEAMEQCRLLMKGYMEVGLRQGGKSEFEASVTGYNALMFKDTQNVIVGGNDPDLALLKDKVDFGLKNMWAGLAIPRLDKDWRKPQVRLGLKLKNNDDDVWSYLVIRNADAGKNTEAPAGTTSKSFVMDEVGKYPFSQTFEAAKPAFLSEFGWRCIPVLVGTGGSFDKGADAERFFYNPDANNFLAFLDPETGKQTCLFMSGIYRQDCKKEVKLSDWLISERGLLLPDTTELDKITIRVADKEKAEAKIKEERETKAKDPDQTEYLKAIMYHPLTPQECFLSSADNYYNGSLAKKQKEKLVENDIKGMFFDMEHDGEKVVAVPSKKLPVSTFPVKKTENTDAPVVIWEHPIPSPPFGLYVAGVDPFRFSKADNSDSLGAVYIFKRIHDITGEKFQDMFVASYVARPENKADWNEQARLLIKYYNARTLCENDEYSFCDYMITKGDGHMLEDTPQWLREFIPGSSTLTRDKGISRANEKVREHLRSNFKQYMEEPFIREKDENGSVIKEVLGVTKILDPLLLTEIEKWNIDGNFDREVAASLAIICARKLDNMKIKVSSTEMDPRLRAIYKKDVKKNRNNKPGALFNQPTTPKQQSKNKIFR